MSVTWNVQPYRWLHELDANYAMTRIATTRSAAQQTAIDAEQWMKDNAPWKDRTGAARKGLRVLVDEDREELKAYEDKLSKARSADSSALRKTNTQRKASGLVPLAAVSKRSSQVERVNLEFRKNRFPIVDLIFKHDYERVIYARWLEIANGGRYSIIAPALDYWGPKLMNNIKRLNNLVQFQGMYTFGEEISPEEMFKQYVERRSQEPGGYQPWNEELRQNKRRNRRYYQNREEQEYGYGLPSIEDERRLNEYERKHGRQIGTW